MIVPVITVLAQPASDAGADGVGAGSYTILFLSVAFCCLALNALFAMAQAALAAVGPASIELIEEDNSFLGKRIEGFLDNRRANERQVWAAAIFCMMFMLVLLVETGRRVWVDIPLLGPIVGVAIGLLLHFLVVEVFARNFALFRPLGFFYWAVPIAWAISLPMQLILFPSRLLRGPDPFPAKGGSITDMELRLLPSLRGVDRIIDEDAFEMIDSVKDFAETTAEEIMTPRTEIEGIVRGLEAAEVYEKLRNSENSRVVVYEEDLDHVLGILLVKEILLQRPEDPMTMLRRPVFASEKSRLPELLQKIRHNQTHLVIILDEYGGTSGIVTLHDLFESIVGHIEDVEDEDELWIDKLGDGKFRLNGRVELWEVNEELGLALDENSSRTIGGYVFSNLGRAAQQGDQITSPEMSLTVEEVEDNRVASILIEVHQSLLQSTRQEMER